MKQLLSGCRFRGSFDEVAVVERRAGADEGDEVRVRDRPAQRSWAASMSLKALFWQRTERRQVVHHGPLR
jgi:hypothetical protein